MITTFKNAQNPQELIESMLKNNPNVKQLIDSNGGDPKKTFYSLAEKQGVNPNDILDMLK